MVLIFSMPKSAKSRDVRLSAAVSLALDSAGGGQDQAVTTGTAALDCGRVVWPTMVLAGKERG
jgi:hypothetical protein